MWTSCDDTGDFIRVKQFDVRQGLHLKQKLVSGTFGGVSRTTLFGSQNSIGHLTLRKYFDKGLGDFFGTFIKTSGAAHPKHNFGLFSCSDHRRDCRDFHSVIF